MDRGFYWSLSGTDGQINLCDIVETMINEYNTYSSLKHRREK